MSARLSSVVLTLYGFLALYLAVMIVVCLAQGKYVNAVASAVFLGCMALLVILAGRSGPNDPERPR